MRKLFGLAAAMSLFLGAAQPAHAVVQSLSSASLTVTISALDPIVAVWNATGSADVDLTSITGLTAGIFSFTGDLPVTDPGAFPIAGLSVSGVTNAEGNFFGVVGVGAVGGGAMAVQGVSNVCLFATCSPSAFPSNITVPFTTGPGANGVGLGGLPITVKGVVNVTVNGNTWTTGVSKVPDGKGGFLADADGVEYSQSGSPLDASGHVKLVSPVQIQTNIGASANLPMFAVMDLTFAVIPEPGTLLLLASGVAGLALVGRKRMSK